MGYIELYTNPLKMLLRDTAHDNKSHLYETLKGDGMNVSWPIFERWLDEYRTTFEIEFRSFPSLINATRLPYMFFTNKEMSEFVSVHSIIPKEEWHLFGVELSKFLDEGRQKYGSISEVSKIFGVNRNTISLLIRDENYITKTRIQTGQVLGWIYDEGKTEVIHDANFMYTGDLEKDTEMLDSIRDNMVAEDPSPYNAQFTSQRINNAHLYINNGYKPRPTVTDDVCHNVLMYLKAEIDLLDSDRSQGLLAILIDLIRLLKRLIKEYS